MDVSKQLATTAIEDAVSMYLSFDESLSNISYKSTATSSINTSEQTGKDDSNGNATLEPEKDDTMKDALETSELSNAFAPLRLQPILREFNALSSTPSKKEDNKHGDHIVLSGNGASLTAKRKSTLSGEFKKMITAIEKNLNKVNEHDKENKLILTDDSLPSFSKTSLLELQKAKAQSATVSNGKQKLKSDNIVVGNSIEKTKKNIPTVKKKVKMHTVARKSLCEPNLQTNRPARIVPNKPRYSYMNNGEAINVGGTMWPLYHSNKFHKSDDENQLAKVDEIITPSEETVEILGDKLAVKPFRKSLKPNKVANIARKSVLPSSSSEIRYAPQRRMSTLVKTTLNSSTRKVPRKSIASLPNTAVSQRRSVLLLQSKLASPLLSRKRASYRSGHTASSTSSDNLIPPVRATGGGDTGKRSPRSQSNGRKTMQIEKPEVKYTCSECGAFYNVRHLLDEHKRTTHRVTSPESVKLRSHNNGGSTSASHGIGASNATNNRCKYCDKGFAIERALHIHLLEHCPKIPAAERRKLNFKEMDHVVKAETPHFRLGAPRQHKKNISTLIDGSKDPLLNFPVKKFQEKIENELLNKNTKDDSAKKEEKTTPTNEQTEKSNMGPPTSSKIKKKTAHVGVYRTPNKDIPCLPCKQSFKNIIDYTNHMMIAHKSLNSNNDNVNTRND